jgi:hypothetical protein
LCRLLNQVVADELTILRRGRRFEVRLRVTVNAQEIPTLHVLDPLFEVIEMQEILEAKVSVDDVKPILASRLIDESRAKHVIQTHDLDQPGNLHPVRIPAK